MQICVVAATGLVCSKLKDFQLVLIDCMNTKTKIKPRGRTAAPLLFKASRYDGPRRTSPLRRQGEEVSSIIITNFVMPRFFVFFVARQTRVQVGEFPACLFSALWKEWANNVRDGLRGIQLERITSSHWMMCGCLTQMAKAMHLARQEWLCVTWGVRNHWRGRQRTRRIQTRLDESEKGDEGGDLMTYEITLGWSKRLWCGKKRVVANVDGNLG